MKRKNLYFIFYLFYFAQLRLTAQFLGANDTTFNVIDKGYGFGDGCDGSIYTTAIQSDNKIIIGGMFNKYNGVSRQNIARLLPDGSVDTTFNPGTGANSNIYCSAVLPNAKIIIGGQFYIYNGTTIKGIARLNQNGSLDTSFHTGSGTYGGTVNSVTVLNSGKILAAGSFTNYAGTACNKMIRINTDGTLDTSFHANICPIFVSYSIYDIAVQPDNKILIGGDFLTSNGAYKNAIARLNANGSIDTTFHGTGANAIVVSVGLQSDGKIVIGGGFTSYSGTGANRVARINADGSIDNTFNAGAGSTSTVNKVKIQTDGKIIIGGVFTTFAGVSCKRLVRLNTNGTLDNTFITTGVNGTLQNINITQTNKILVVGDFTTYNDTARNHISSVYPSGAVDLTFNQQTGANGNISKVIVQPDGKIIIGGGFKMFNGKPMNNLARLNTDGSVDTTFHIGSGFDNTVEALALQADGKILVGGNFILYNGVTHNRLIRLNPNGSTDNTFNVGSGPNSTVYNIHYLSSGKIIISGYLTSYNANPRSYVARINANGSIDNTFNTTETYGYAYASVVQPDGKVIFGGGPCTIGGQNKDYVIRLNTDGTRDMTFQLGGTSSVQTILGMDLQSNGKVIVAGGATMWNGINNCYRILRLNTDGTFDTTFYHNAGTNERYVAVKVQDDDKIIGVGVFNWFSGAQYNHILRLNADGNLDPQFNVWQGTGLTNQPNAIAIQPDKKIIIAGNFTGYLNYGRNRIARIITIPSHLIQNPQAVCDGNSYFINGHNYNTAGTYNDTLQNIYGADSVIVTQLTIAPNPTVSVSSSFSICQGSSANLIANGAATYSWSTGETTSSITVNPATNQSYIVTGASVSCTDAATVSITVDNTCQDVWPGDANSDGIADNIDVLELGLHYTQTGAPRSSVSNSWQSYQADNWAGTISNGKNLNHSDCNGDGTINNDDTLAIYNNYGLTHAFRENNIEVTNPQLSIVPNESAMLMGYWGSADIFLGDASNPITNINGVAFTVDFDNSLIETGSIYLEYTNSFIDASNQNLKFRKLDFANGKLYAATTHTNNINVSGNGKIGTLHYKIKYPLTQTYTLQIGLSQANQSDASGIVTPLTSGSGTVEVINGIVGVQNLSNDNLISVSPNPATNELTVRGSTEIEKIEITNITGQIILSEQAISKNHKLNLENISNGVYFVKVYNRSKQVSIRKLVVQK